MFTDGDMGERHGRVLAELAETGMVMVRRLSDAMLATDDVQAQAQIGMAFHRVSRAVRQTLALEFRLSQEPRRDERPAAARETPPPEATPGPPRPPVERTSWNEYERDDSREALEDLDVLLGAEELDLEAVDAAVETCIANIRRDLDDDRVLTGVPETARASADRRPPRPDPGARRSRLLGGAATPPLLPAAPRPGLRSWRSSA